MSISVDKGIWGFNLSYLQIFSALFWLRTSSCELEQKRQKMSLYDGLDFDNKESSGGTKAVRKCYQYKNIF